jgi:hypothetical protein
VNKGWLMLKEAAKVVKKRGKKYGPARKNHENVAGVWSVILGHPVTPVQVAMCMVGVKLARLIETPNHKDSAVDIAGYAACLRECQVETVNREKAKCLRTTTVKLERSYKNYGKARAKKSTRTLSGRKGTRLRRRKLVTAGRTKRASVSRKRLS